MPGSDLLKKLWPGGKIPTSGGPYEYKGVRFKLRASPSRDGSWSFQAFGHEPRRFASWDEAGPAIEETCVEIHRHRVNRRDNV